MTLKAPKAMGPRPQRKSVAPRWVLLGLLLSFAVAFCIAAFLYNRYVAYDRVAALHLLHDPDWAVRIDLEKVALYEPFRKHLLPMVLAGNQDSRLKPRLERLRQHSRVELGVDIREIAFSQRTGHWVLAVGGMFPRRGVAEGIHRVLKEERRESEFDPMLGVLSMTNGIAVRQATDGAVLFASDRKSLTEGFTPDPTSGRATVPPWGAASLAVGLERSGAPGIQCLTATLTPGSPHRVVLEVETVPQAAPVPELERWLAERAAVLANFPTNSVRLRVSGPNRLQAELSVSGEQLDAALREFAKHLRAVVFSAP